MRKIIKFSILLLGICWIGDVSAADSNKDLESEGRLSSFSTTASQPFIVDDADDDARRASQSGNGRPWYSETYTRQCLAVTGITVVALVVLLLIVLL